MLFHIQGTEIRLLDAGAGDGSLITAFVRRSQPLIPKGDKSGLLTPTVATENGSLCVPIKS